MRIEVVPTADAVVPADLDGVTALVIDVLRASTTIITAFAHGCREIVPVRDPADARRRAGAVAGDGGLTAGERGGEPIPGFDLGNSPVEFGAARLDGKTVFLTTSNGTRTLLAARTARAIGVAALLNVTAAAAWAAAGGRDVTVLCSGSLGAPALEDWTCAGLVVARLLATIPAAVLSEGARDALDTGRRYRDDLSRLKRDAPWARKLIAAGRSADVDACLRLDTTTLVPRYVPSVDKIVGDPR
ncbi:MAG: 2-phosphosulfolactate phosphatase [Candidatus Rokuibacteriota bacterium]|nr:MAG: 2-phosphosulfolactate phosphatase [Candidatus Rokubacteria bacterium]PYN53671.1 MAG: 2-phosphosulfolactate phosphatase [Candidatus Rokubacteria bacterium]